MKTPHPETYTITIRGSTRRASGKNAFRYLSGVYCKARDESGEGNSTFRSVDIKRDGKIVAHISYNGRVWAGPRKTSGTGTLLYDNIEGPFNPFAHEMLTSDGAFIHTHMEADFDDGDAENGPGYGGHDAYDLYEGESHDIVIDRSGLIVHVGLINWDEVRFFEGQDR